MNEAIHWSQIGAANGYLVFTHDLDFGTLLAANKTSCPSVIQIRTQDVTPENLLNTIISVLHQFEEHIEKGALITVDEYKARVRILPNK